MCNRLLTRVDHAKERAVAFDAIDCSDWDGGTQVDTEHKFMSRRLLMGGTAASLAGMVSTWSGPPPAAAEVAARRAPSASETVFLHLNQEDLDRAYDQNFWAPDAAETLASYARLSAQVRDQYKYSTYSYGRSRDERLDVFPAAGDRAPIVMFIHGGAWRVSTKEEASFPAPTFVDAGIHYVAPDFSLLPGVRLPDMVNQLRRAMVWVFRNASRFGGDRQQIHLVGHSSGAHLTAVLAATNWAAYGLPRDVIKTATCLSGMFDLYPVLLSSRRDYVKLSARERDELSPILHLNRIRGPLVLAVGTQESPEFIRQTEQFGAALRDRSPHYFRMQDVDHFKLPLRLRDASAPLTAKVLDLVSSTR